MDVWCVCAFFCVCVVLCLDRGLATVWTPVQGVLPSVNDQETENSALYSKVGASSQMVAKRKKNKSTVNVIPAQITTDTDAPTTALTHSYHVIFRNLIRLLSRLKRAVSREPYFQVSRIKSCMSNITSPLHPTFYISASKIRSKYK
jgi:hypothetical protein